MDGAGPGVDPQSAARRRRTVAVAALIGAILGLAIGSLRSPAYEANATLFVDASYGAPVKPDSADVEFGPADRPLLESVASLATSKEVIDRVMSTADLGLTPGQIVDSLKLMPLTEAGVIRITGKADTPERATALANATATVTASTLNEQRKRQLKRVGRKLADQLQGASGDDLVSLVADQLRVVSALAGSDPIQIQSEARLPDGAVTAGPFRLTMIGALVGLIGSTLLTLRRPVRRREEVAPEFDELNREATFIDEPDPAESAGIEVVPASDGPLRPEAIRRLLPFPVVSVLGESVLGRTPFIDSAERVARGAEVAQLSELVSGVRQLCGDRDPSPLLVTSALRDQGKTTVATSLAAAAALVGQQVLLVEADLQNPSLGKRLGLKPGPGMADYLRGEAKPGEILYPATVTSPRRNDSGQLVVIPAGGRSNSPSELLLGNPRFEGFYDKVTRVYDLIVFDAGPLLADSGAAQLFEFAELGLVCLRLSDAKPAEIGALLEILDNASAPEMAAVLTGRQG